MIPYSTVDLSFPGICGLAALLIGFVSNNVARQQYRGRREPVNKKPRNYVLDITDIRCHAYEAPIPQVMR